MSVVDTDGLDGSTYRTTFDPSAEPPCVAVVEAIEAALGSAAPDCVLADSIDPDTLQQLYRDGGGSWMLSFDHGGYEITLWAGGRIHVETTQSTTGCETNGRPARAASRPLGPTQSTGPSL